MGGWVGEGLEGTAHLFLPTVTANEAAHDWNSDRTRHTGASYVSDRDRKEGGQTNNKKGKQHQTTPTTVMGLERRRGKNYLQKTNKKRNQNRLKFKCYGNIKCLFLLIMKPVW